MVVVVTSYMAEECEAVDSEKLERVTYGRRKIPISMLLRDGGRHASSFSSDVYVSATCWDVYESGEEKGFKISDFLISGSTEARVIVTDCSDIVKPTGGQVSWKGLVGSTLLILNPRPIGGDRLCIPNLKSCLKLGTAEEIGKCQIDGCPKPLLLNRETLCTNHSRQKDNLRLSIGGDVRGRDEMSTTSAVPAAVEKPKVVLSAAEIEEKKRIEIAAKKKAGMYLFNRRSSGAGRTSGTFPGGRLSLSSEDKDGMMDLGEIQKTKKQDIGEAKKNKKESATKSVTKPVSSGSVTPGSREWLEAFKRKRALIEKADQERLEKRRQSEEKAEQPSSIGNAAEHELVVCNENEVPARNAASDDAMPPPAKKIQKPLLAQFDSLIKQEREMI